MMEPGDPETNQRLKIAEDLLSKYPWLLEAMLINTNRYRIKVLMEGILFKKTGQRVVVQYRLKGTR